MPYISKYRREISIHNDLEFLMLLVEQNGIYLEVHLHMKIPVHD